MFAAEQVHTITLCVCCNRFALQHTTRYLSRNTLLAAAPLFTFCLKRPTAAPAAPSSKVQSAVIGQITRSVVIGQLLTAVLVGNCHGLEFPFISYFILKSFTPCVTP